MTIYFHYIKSLIKGGREPLSQLAKRTEERGEFVLMNFKITTEASKYWFHFPKDFWSEGII